MQIFQVMSDGEVHEIFQENTPIKDLLNSKECYILSDDIERIVYLWKGSEAKVRSKFIGARKIQDVRSQVGLNYRSISMDEDEVNPKEHSEFLAAVVNPRQDGFAKEIREEGVEIAYEIGGGPEKPKSYSQMMNSKFNSNIQQTGPLYTDQTSLEKNLSPNGFNQQVRTVSQSDLEKIIEELNSAEPPEGYTREMVIIGDKSYSQTEKVQNVFGKKQIKRELEEIDSLPEGVFLAEGYVPRVLVHNQTVIAVEFLRKE